MSHRFQLGQLVRPTSAFADRSGGVYEVVRLLPMTPNGEYHYRIKAASGPERAVSESQIAASADAALSAAG